MQRYPLALSQAKIVRNLSRFKIDDKIITFMMLEWAGSGIVYWSRLEDSRPAIHFFLTLHCSNTEILKIPKILMLSVTSCIGRQIAKI